MHNDTFVRSAIGEREHDLNFIEEKGIYSWDVIEGCTFNFDERSCRVLIECGKDDAMDSVVEADAVI